MVDAKSRLDGRAAQPTKGEDMDHLEKAIDVLNISGDEFDFGGIEAAMWRAEAAKAHALIALAEMLDSVTYSDEHGNRYIRVSSE